MSLSLETIVEIQKWIMMQAKAQHFSKKLTQEVLTKRPDVNLSSMKHFEHTRHISLDVLIRVAFVLDCLPLFKNLFIPTIEVISLGAFLQSSPLSKRGRIK